MKRQNSSSDNHTTPSNNNVSPIIYPLELSSPIMATPPYNRNGSHGGGGRRRKLLNSTAERSNRELHPQQQPSSSSSLLSSTNTIGSAATTLNSPINSHKEISTTQIDNHNNNTAQDEEGDTKKLRHTHRSYANQNPLLTLYQTLQTKLHYYRVKLSKLSPRQKFLMCTALIVWKFVQVWLVVHGIVYLSGGTASGGSGGGEIKEGSGASVVKVGQSMNERLKLEKELRMEIERSRVEEGRLEEERLWIRQDEDESGGGLQQQQRQRQQQQQGNDAEEWIEANDVGAAMATKTRILYILTVSCPTTPQQNLNSNNSHNNDVTTTTTTTATNMNNILSTLSTNIQTMITHPEGYTVDVYWILGCSWSDDDYFDNNLLNGVDKKKERNDVSEYWNEYIAQQLPEGVGLQVWEDAMPLDYSSSIAVSSSGNQTTTTAVTSLSPSIDKFMKQHRHVVRDKLDNYDVFLSFGASLQQNDPQPSSSSSAIVYGPTGDLVQVNGSNVEFCSQNLYRDTKISCSDRVEYLMKRYGNAKNVAMVSLLKQKECICSSARDGVESDVKPASRPSQLLQRITGDHIETFLSLSSELNELPNGKHIIPGFVSVDAVTSAATTKSINTSGSQQFRVDASPCCDSNSMELIVGTKGGAAINADEWQMMQVESTDSADGIKDKSRVEAPPSEWIAIEKRSADATTTPAFQFYEDGWMLTKEQLLRLDYGSNRGKFLPPFLSNKSTHRQSLVSPLFDSADKGGLGLHRAISLDPNRFSKQLIHQPSHVLRNAPLGVKELLHQFHTANKEKV